MDVINVDNQVIWKENVHKIRDLKVKIGDGDKIDKDKVILNIDIRKNYQNKQSQKKLKFIIKIFFNDV